MLKPTNASNSEKGDDMENKILEEISDFCNHCSSKECCPENECVLFRIENIIQNENDDTIEE